MRCQNIYKSYGSRAVLKNVSLALTPGKVTILRGHSGCGKTTLLRCLAGLEHVDSGEIFTAALGREERNITGLKAGSLYPTLTVVFQQLFLWPHLTCRKNIELVAKDSDVVSALIDRFGLEEVLDRTPNKVSLGQKQRVAIVRALSFDADIILLDEVTSALDAKNRRIVSSALLERAQAGARILCITHDDTLAHELNGITCLMENGEIVGSELSHV